MNKNKQDQNQQDPLHRTKWTRGVDDDCFHSFDEIMPSRRIIFQNEDIIVNVCILWQAADSGKVIRTGRCMCVQDLRNNLVYSGDNIVREIGETGIDDEPKSVSIW